MRIADLRSVVAQSQRGGGGPLRAGKSGVDADDRHRDTLAPGDLILIYLAAPGREFIGRAEVATAAPGCARVVGDLSP
jgi:hypothetical protein